MGITKDERVPLFFAVLTIGQSLNILGKFDGVLTPQLLAYGGLIAGAIVLFDILRN